MSTVGQVVVYSLLFVVMAVNGQVTRGGENESPEIRVFQVFMRTLETTIGIVHDRFNRLEADLNERFDRIEGKIERMEVNLNELKGNVSNVSNNLNELRTKQNTFELKMDAVIRSLKNFQGNVTNLSVTSQSNHVDQLNKMEQVAAVVQSNNEEVAQSCVNNVTRQLLVFTEKISNTTQRACDQHEDTAQGCSLLNVANADVTQLYLSFVNVSCRQGYHFNHLSWIITQCHDNNTWSPMPGNCTDVDECLVNNGGCSRYATCTNLPGSFTCACKPGFSGNGLTCSDVNECVVKNGGCSQDATCTNLPGSFSCTCKPGFSGNGLTCSALPRDCADIRAQGQTTNGVYTVYLGEMQRPLAVYCDMTTGSVGWVVFQRRQDGSVDFHRNWRDYQTGFGNISAEFWIGNDNLHLITSGKRYKLRVELTAFDGSTAYAEFDNFKVASAADKYRLTSIGDYSGTAGDSLSYHVGQQFSTKDNDQSSVNCAVSRKGAWWYVGCGHSNLNGFYYQTQTHSRDAVNWAHWKNYMSMKRTEMKLSPFI